MQSIVVPHTQFRIATMDKRYALLTDSPGEVQVKSRFGRVVSVEGRLPAAVNLAVHVYWGSTMWVDRTLNL